MNAADIDDNEQENDSNDSIENTDDSDQAPEPAKADAGQFRVRTSSNPIIINK